MLSRDHPRHAPCFIPENRFNQHTRATFINAGRAHGQSEPPNHGSEYGKGRKGKGTEIDDAL